MDNAWRLFAGMAYK